MKVKSLLHSICGKGKTELVQDQIRVMLNQPHCWGILDISKSNSKAQKKFFFFWDNGLLGNIQYMLGALREVLLS